MLLLFSAKHVNNLHYSIVLRGILTFRALECWKRLSRHMGLLNLFAIALSSETNEHGSLETVYLQGSAKKCVLGVVILLLALPGCSLSYRHTFLPISVQCKIEPKQKGHFQLGHSRGLGTRLF